MGMQEQVFVQEAFDTNWVAPVGPNIDGFESDLCAFTGAKHSVVLSSGTSALHLGLILLDVRAGDLVLCQSMTFSASANPIVYQGATPVFIDSEPDTWNMDPVALETAIKDCIAKEKKPKAIIPVHLYGMPAKMNEILHIARMYEIPVLEDAAEALGSTYHGIPCGTLGDLGVLSFNGNKIITTSSGGALIGNDAATIQQARFLSTQARDQAPHYQHSHIGYNYRMSNVLAGIGRGQMIVLPERVAQRRSNYERYLTLLGNVPGIQFVPEPNGFFSNRWLTTILVDPALTGGLTRETIRLKLEEYNIESRPLWKPMHLQPVFADCPFYGDGTAARLFDQGLCLPSGSNLVDADFSRIFEVLTQILPC
jgi:dTDP-4-amino-4,6-dideoxygalactose transaminase